MPGTFLPDTHTGITADILRQLRRRQNAAAASQALIWEYDEFAITGVGDTTHTLSWLPYGINVIALNGLVLRQGTDYTVNTTTGVVIVTATLTAGDVLLASYVTTGELKVYSTAPDTGNLLLETESTFETGMTNWTAAWTATPISRATTGGRTAGGCIVQTATGTASNLAIITTTRGIPVVVGATYEIGVWWKGAITSSTINVNQATSGGTYAGSLGCSSFGGSDTPGADGWAFRSGQFTVPTGVSYVQVNLVPYQLSTVAGDTVTYDDIYLMRM